MEAGVSTIIGRGSPTAFLGRRNNFAGEPPYCLQIDLLLRLENEIDSLLFYGFLGAAFGYARWYHTVDRYASAREVLNTALDASDCYSGRNISEPLAHVGGDPLEVLARLS